VSDAKYKEIHKEVANFCGATAVVCILLGNKLICANVGDARAILCRNGKALDLSIDHKAVRIILLMIFCFRHVWMNKRE
jgi:serine/threonine protein phosphatase PrpC